MNYRKKKLFGILTLCLGVIFICISFFTVQPRVIAPTINSEPQKSDSVFGSTKKESEQTITENPLKQNSITFSVSGRVLNLSFDVGDTLEKVIKDAVAKKIIDVKGENFSGLGFFVDEINEIKAGNGYSWIYYINGVKATVGVSTYKLQNNDSINWRYEKNY